MKLLISLALLVVVSALPPRHEFGYRHHKDSQLEGPSFHQNSYHQLNLIKSIYNQLIESLNHPSQDEKEEEEKAINDIVDTINMIGQIIHDNSNDGDDIIAYNRPSKPQHPEHYGQEVDELNKPSASYNEDRSTWQREKKVPFIEDNVEVISSVYKLAASDENKSSEVFVVDNVPKDVDSEPDVSSVNEKGNGENSINAYNSINVANEVPAL